MESSGWVIEGSWDVTNDGKVTSEIFVVTDLPDSGSIIKRLLDLRENRKQE